MKKQLIIMDFKECITMNHLSVIKTVFGWIAVICMGRNAIVMKKELLLSND